MNNNQADRQQLINAAVEAAEDPQMLASSLAKMEPFKFVKAFKEVKFSSAMSGAIQYYVTDANELVELHARYAELVQRSHEMYMQHLDDETREFLLREARTIIAYMYRHIEAWLPYSLFFEASETQIAGVGFFFNIVLVDVREHIDKNREATLLELEAAEEVLDHLLNDIDFAIENDKVDPDKLEDHLVVLFNPDDTTIIRAVAEANGMTESDFVQKALLEAVERLS